ncbi:hypothetical protein B0H21DRAFT_712877, partial [Amylocystis lapponica]
MPRLRLSTDHLKFIIWIFRELGVASVPSFKVFCKKQDTLNKTLHICTEFKHAPIGHVFYQNNVPDLIALPYIEEYPIRTQTIGESYHSQEWMRAHIIVEDRQVKWVMSEMSHNYFNLIDDGEKPNFQ